MEGGLVPGRLVGVGSGVRRVGSLVYGMASILLTGFVVLRSEMRWWVLLRWARGDLRCRSRWISIIERRV